MSTTTRQTLLVTATRMLSLIVASDIPLAPGSGGRSIGADALQVGDIIISTTPAPESVAIRLGTGAEVSHAILYIGDGLVVESILQGVVQRTLDEALADASLAVAVRHPRLSPEQALHVRDFAGQAIGLKYDGVGIVKQAIFRIDAIVGRVLLSFDDEQRFFCSELVAAAFESAGAPLTAVPPSWTAPSDLQDLYLSLLLDYVGHLKTAP